MNKSILSGIMLSGLLSLMSCGAGGETDSSYTPKLTEAEIQAGVFTPEIMMKMGRLSDSHLSPDGQTVLYGVTVYNIEENAGYTNLYLAPVNGDKPYKLTKGDYKDSNARWGEQGKKIYFLSDRSGSSELWSIDADGKNMKQLTNLAQPINAFELSPAGDKIWYTTQIKVEENAKDIYPNFPKSNVKIYDDLMVRHWNYWLDGTYSHLIVADIVGDTIKNGIDIMQDEPWDVPLAPNFDISEITWNNEGTQIAYTAKKLKGYEAAISTNSDIYLYDIASGKTRNLTEGMVGYDRYPVFSPNDTRIAWVSMERPGNESDKGRLFVMDLATGEKEYVTKDFDYNAENIQWSDNNTLYFLSPITATYQICKVTIEPLSQVEVITEGLHDYNHIDLKNGVMVAEKTTLSRAPELFSVNLSDGSDKQLTFTNEDIYKAVKMGEVQERWVKTTDGKDMLVWVLLPPDFDPAKKYPTLLYCQGGPQSVISQRWSYRWNLQLIASQGYVVVAPNRRGLPSFGQEWLDQISGDYSGQNIKDYLSAIDDVSKEPWVDKDRRGCVGASYGGYSTFFLAGNHEKRFKTFIAHCGMFNLESFYGATEELWFPNNDLKGSYWSDNATARRSYANSPHRFVQNWDTPIMIIVGEKDYRIPYTESLQAFTAARAQGIEARLVVFEDEGHQVFKPQNSLVWQSEFFKWLDKYLKQPQAE
ncbi:MAG TPA: S9 family peptidase [Candidatus Avirikenella pullistercoris]|nr:S9 family peptidase [Candidatus Avirikenella pullistercoris]